MVNDGTSDSMMDTVSVVVSARSGTNTAPVADVDGSSDTVSATGTCRLGSAGYTCAPCTSATISLDAGGSTDADGDPLRYVWSVDSDYAALDDDRSETPTLTISDYPAAYGTSTTETLTVTLTVYDCDGASDVETFEIDYTCTGS